MSPIVTVLQFKPNSLAVVSPPISTPADPVIALNRIVSRVKWWPIFLLNALQYANIVSKILAV
jgi:hypothetical protein